MKDIAEPQSNRLAPALVAFGPQRRQGVLNAGGNLRIGPYQVGELVDHDGNPPFPAEAEERVDRLMPAVEGQRRGRSGVVCHQGPEAVQRLAVSDLVRREVETSGRLAQRAEQERLPLSQPPVDQTQLSAVPRVSGESSQGGPLTLPAEHPGGVIQPGRIIGELATRW